MEKVWPVVITMIIALLAVAIAYRVRILHKLVFGRGSSNLNAAAEIAANQSAPVGGAV